MPDVHVQPLEADAGGDNAIQLVGPHLGVEQAVAERWPVKHLGLGAGNGAVALQAGEVAPHGGGEQVSREVLSCHALQDGSPLAFGGGLGLLQFLLGGLHSRFELAELGLADALDGEAQRRLLARDELVLGFVPVLLPIAGEAAQAYGFAACAHAGAGGCGLAVHAQFVLEVDAAGRTKFLSHIRFLRIKITLNIKIIINMNK